MKAKEYLENKGIKDDEIVPVYSQDGSKIDEIPIYKLMEGFLHYNMAMAIKYFILNWPTVFFEKEVQCLVDKLKQDES